MRLVLGIGVPGCGKSTYLKPLAQKLGLSYVNPDEVRKELLGDATDHTNEQHVWSTVHRRIAVALSASGVVVDATHTRRKDRRRLVATAKEMDVHDITAYWFNVPLATCLHRNRLRDRNVPEYVIRAMAERLRLHPPTLNEGYTKIIEITQ